MKICRDKGGHGLDRVLFECCESLSFGLIHTEMLFQTGFSKKAAGKLETTWEKVEENVQRLVDSLKILASSSVLS